MGLLQIGVNVAKKSLLQNEGAVVTYSDGNRSISIVAVKSKNELNIDRLTSVSVEGVDASFLVDAAVLLWPVPTIPGETRPLESFVPDRGHKITEADGTVWEVVPFGDIGCYRNSLGMMRIFVKKAA